MSREPHVDDMQGEQGINLRCVMPPRFWGCSLWQRNPVYLIDVPDLLSVTSGKSLRVPEPGKWYTLVV